MNATRLATLVFVPLVLACDTAEPMAVAADASDTPVAFSAGATTTLEELPPLVLPSFFNPYSSCLDQRVAVRGTIYRQQRKVVQPDGSSHITLTMDVSGTTISVGGKVWTAGPNAREMFIFNTTPGGATETVHLGVVVFRAEDGSALRLVHRIVSVQPADPAEGPSLYSEVFDIACAGPND